MVNNSLDADHVIELGGGFPFEFDESDGGLECFVAVFGFVDTAFQKDNPRIPVPNRCIRTSLTC